MRLIYLFILYLLFNSCFAQTSNESERILNFKDEIIVNQDSSIDVKESITVFANQQRIVHGLMRELPISYTDSYGITQHTQYDIRQILLNNAISPYHTTRENNYLKIYIGDKDTFLPSGEYTFTINYHVKDAINFLKDADELYWNVTGNTWDFPIERAQATIVLPQNVTPTYFTAYTGTKGAQGKDFDIQNQANVIYVTSRKPLLPGEGLTVAVAWPKGFIFQPTWKEKLFDLNPSQYLILLISGLLFLYYLFIWLLHGRDAKQGTVIPLFTPPENLSPSAMRYIARMGFDTKNVSATILSLATKGALTIDEKDRKFILVKKSDDTKNLDENEKTFFEKIFSGKNPLTLESANDETIQSADTALAKKLRELYKQKYFITNTFYLIPGILLAIVAFIAAAFSTQGDNGFFPLVWLTVWTVVVLFLLKKSLDALTKIASEFTFSNLLSALGAIGFASVFLFAEITVLYAMKDDLSLVTLILVLFVVLINFVFYFLLKRYTAAGRKLLDQIEGFKMFLGTTEKYRLEQLTPPEKTPELFEKYLPFAVALDVENRWAEQFTEVLNRAQQSGQPYQPSWYQGRSWNNTSPALFPALLTSNLTNSISSVSSSSSASSGGGSSGGGRGGGGGGGW